jgi:1-acyl-sn-glycerol-3-phosphate acyltransferase
MAQHAKTRSNQPDPHDHADPGHDTETDPFEVLDVRPLRQSIPAFLLTLPLTSAGLLGTFALAPFVVPFYKRFPLELKDRTAHAMTFWLMLAAKFRIEVVDHNDSPEDHAQLYIAPHICILEPMALMRALGHIRPVAAAMTKDLPVFGRFVDAADPIYVERGKGDNGPSVVDRLRDSIENTNYRHLIFPEGTYTNGRTLLEFKVGAFAIGKPITPVIFHFPEWVPFWNREESGFATQLYRLAATFQTPIKIEILPTYHPSQEELDDPALYAHNMRALLSERTGRPMSDRSVYDSPNYRSDVAK